MARVSKKKEAELKSELVSALEYVCLNQRDEGTPAQTHCVITNKEIITFDGIIALGVPIETELNICPQSRQMLAALSRISGSYSLTQRDATALALQAGRLRVTIPCLEPENLASASPDAFCAAISDDWRQGLLEIGDIASETASKVEFASVLVRSGTMLATDGIIALEYWHGLNMPQMILPKSFLTILKKIKHKIVSFGYSENTLTFYFENSYWIKTQLYQDTWPIEQLTKILSREIELYPLPFDFADALDAVLPFSDDQVIIVNNKIQTHKQETIGASYDLEINQDAVFDPKKLKQVLPYIKKVNFCTGKGGVALFYGENVRGVICQKLIS